MRKKIFVPCLDVIMIAFFPEKYIVKDHISNTKLEKRDHYYIQTYRSRNLRKWKDFNRKQLTLHKMCVAFVILLQDVVFFTFGKLISKGAGDCLPPRVWVIWVLRPCRYLSTVTRNSNQGSVDGFRRERLQRLATFDSLSVQKRLEAMSRMKNKTIVCYLGGIWKRLEPLEQN